MNLIILNYTLNNPVDIHIGNNEYLLDNWINEYLLEKLQTLQNKILTRPGLICCFSIDT
jgi:hypothetical protein